MSYSYPEIAKVASLLKTRAAKLKDKRALLRSSELAALFAELKTLPADKKASFGKEVNQLKRELERLAQPPAAPAAKQPIDITAPLAPNSPPPAWLPSDQGTEHPLMTELKTVLDIFYRMGFTAVESRELDDEFHMFSSLNFPAGHPARDEFDTFVTKQTDKDGQSLIAPAHTSIMQNRVLKEYRPLLKQGEPDAVVIPGRVFRNEDIDPRHGQTFYQFEGVYVDRDITAGNLLATFKSFLTEYYGQDIKIKSQPFYFPFTEPSFELALSCPFCQGQGCHVCSLSGWIELLGMGLIHPNVLKLAGIDPATYSGFAWGCGLDRLVMMKYDIEDIRHFESGKLEFLRQFK